MGLKDAKEGKLLYHLTELKNLESIIDFGLVPRKILRENTVTFGDVADPEIIRKRESLGLDGYIPFHFHPYSAFDVAVKKTHAGEEMIYICITRNLARRNNFSILPKHPLVLEGCQLYDYDEGFEMINWDILTSVGQNDVEARNIKMAECLSPLVIPVDAFQCIYVSSEETKNRVTNLLKQKGVIFPPPFITVMSQWFE